MVLIVLVWSTEATRAMDGKPRLVENKTFSTLLEKLQPTKDGTKFETILDLLDRIGKILREPAKKYQKNNGQTYHGLRLI